MSPASPVVVSPAAVDPERRALVGGKAASLARLTRVDGVDVPDGFCVTTVGFDQMLRTDPAIATAIAGLTDLGTDPLTLAESSGAIRRRIETAPMPDAVTSAVTDALDRLGPAGPWAVRSSATVEDLPTASVAGQHDSFLGVVGADEVLDRVRRCWASLFTDRAVAYRAAHGIDQRKVEMAVVVQRLVDARVSGVVFTADPLTGNRRLAVVEAVAGLGDALVSGRVAPDRFVVGDHRVIERSGARRPAEVVAEPSGRLPDQPTLTEEQVLALVDLARRIEAHLGGPQDIEWCLTDRGFHIVQSRPITTLFPIPETAESGNRVYLSVGHQQMMTDPIAPLGLSVWLLTALRPMDTAGGRLFVDVTDALASPAQRDALVAGMGQSDPLMGDALRTLVERPGFLPPVTEAAPVDGPTGRPAAAPVAADPTLFTGLIERNRASVDELRRVIATKTGTDLIDFIETDIIELKRLLTDPQSHAVLMAGMGAAWWLNERVATWLGEPNVADTISQSVPHNVTAEMGLDLLTVADVIRPLPEVVAFLAAGPHDDERFLDELADRPGGAEARRAIEDYLDRYGMRGIGEIDITRPRFSERPTTLVPMILANVASFGPGEAGARFERGRREAEAKAQDVLARLAELPDGEAKAADAKERIDLIRAFAGYREYPKYGMVSRYFEYKRALLAEADRLVQAGVVTDPEDIFCLSLAELRDAIVAQRVDADLIARRRADLARFATLTPPRVLTSAGEAVVASYHRDDVPAGALVGLGVSSGVVEGRARVILDPAAAAEVEPGDILVTPHTDPAWSPLFVAVSGLVTEVGGQMTHGAVIAREYGLPAVVGVPDATRRITDGQPIRLDATSGHVELLS